MNRVPWLLLLAGCALAILFGSLAHWQYRRGEAKQLYLQDWNVAMNAPRQALDEALPSDTVIRPRQVLGTLQAVPGLPWILLDNQRRGSEVGVRVCALMRVASSRPLLLVDFGWARLGPGRALPELPMLPERLQVDGMLLPWPGQAIRLAADAWPDGDAVLLTALDRNELSARAGAPLVDGVLQVSPQASFGFERELRALPNTLPAEKHYGYALQWAGLALAVLVTMAWLMSRRVNS